MTAPLKRGLSLIVVAFVIGLVGCMTTVPTVTLSGVPSTITQGTVVTGITATATPGSSSALWFFTFSSTCGGTFTPSTVGPTNLLTVTTSFDSTGTTPGSCTIKVEFRHGGRTATDSANTTIVVPNLGFYYFKGASPSDSIMRLGSAGFGAGVLPNTTCSTVFPGQIECDDDAGYSYTDYGGFTASSLNSGLAGNMVSGTEELVIHGYNGAAMCTGTPVPGTTGCALYRHNPSVNIPETSDPQTLPTIPPCTSPQTDAGTFASGEKKIFPIGPTGATAWYITGTLDDADTSDSYTFVVPGSGINPGDVIFIALNGTSNDYDLRISGPPGSFFTFDIDDEFIATPIPTGGTYTISVERFSGSGPYHLTVCKAWP